MAGTLTLQLANGANAGAVSDISGTATAKSADYTVTDADRISMILMTSGAAAKTVTLPTAADNAHRVITIKKIDSGAGTVIIDGEGAETIEDAATLVLYLQYDTVTLQCDGTEWFVVNESYAGGTYTPTVTNSTGFSSISAAAGQFTRTRKAVTVSISFNGTTDGAEDKVTITVPVANASNIAACSGTATVSAAGAATTSCAGWCGANASATNIQARYYTAGITQTFYATFTYAIP